jgi:GNAT superfamily N-acetyltransferase
VLRPATSADLPRLVAVEVRAGRRFLEVGMPEIAGDDPGRIEDPALVEVAVEDGEIVGYVELVVVDDALHVEQLSIVPEAAGRRLGAALLDRAAERARALGLARLTLTTFAEVPWNAPYYRRLGFEVIEDPGPELTALVAHEAEAIPGDGPRVCMARPVR